MRTIVVLASAIAVSAVGATAQSRRPDPRAAEYSAWMQSIPPVLRSLTTNINGKMGDMAAADADRLEDVFRQVEDFWGQRNVQDAVAFTQTARTALAAASKDAKAEDFEAALADLKTLQTTCAGCHAAHREGEPGSFSIK